MPFVLPNQPCQSNEGTNPNQPTTQNVQPRVCAKTMHVVTTICMSAGAKYLVHGEVREQHDDVVLDAHYQSSVVLIAACNHLHVVAHLEELLQLVSRKLQRVLQRHASQ